MDKSQEIYGKLYDIASQNLSQSGGEFVYSRETFLASTSCKPGVADILALNDLDNMSYIQGLYVFLFYRTCDEEALRSWSEKSGMPADEFRKKAVNSLMRSQEFCDKGTVVNNNPYSSRNEVSREIAVRSGGALMGNGHPAEVGVNKLYRFYKKLPKPIRDLIRWIVGIK